MKILEEALGLARRYGPTVIAHLMFFLWLSLFVVDLSALPDGRTLWKQLSGNIDGSMAAVGLSTDRWYVLGALALAYLTAFEWLRGSVSALPGLRITFRHRTDPQVLAEACYRFGLDPNPGEVQEALDRQIDRAAESVRQKNEVHPYQWMAQREGVLHVYHGTLLLGLLAMIAWGAVGPEPYVRSQRLVWMTAFLLGAASLGLRWYIKRLHRQRLDYTGYWALSQMERPEGSPTLYLIHHHRAKALRIRAQQAKAAERHPASIATRWLRHVPEPWRERLRKRIRYPSFQRPDDWQLLASSCERFAPDQPAEASVLDASPFEARFSSLLERPGTGLCILVPSRSELAVGPGHRGSQYSFASRRHESEVFGIVLSARTHLREKPRPLLRADVRGGRAFIACAGRTPLAQLVLGERPDHRLGWSRLLWIGSEADWPVPERKEEAEVDGVTVADTAPLSIGASYVLGVETKSGTRATLALQCFRIADSERLLVAWAFLHVHEPIEDPEMPLPWWNPKAWRDLVRKDEPASKPL